MGDKGGSHQGGGGDKGAAGGADGKKEDGKGGKGKKGKEEVKEPPKPPPTPLEVLYRGVFLLDKYADSRDGRFLARVLRYSAFLRGALPMAQLRAAVDMYVPDPGRRAVVQALVTAAAERRPEPVAAAAVVPPVAPAAAAPAPAMEVENGGAAAAGASPAATPAPAAAAPPRPPRPSATSSREVEAYLSLLCLGMLQTAGAWGALAEGARALLAHVSGFNVRTLDTFAARCWSMLALAAEHGAPCEAEALTPALLAAYRTCCLRHDDYGQAVTLNLLLRTHVRASAFDAASKLLSKASFPEAASPAQLCRYLYYKGRVQAVLLDYSDALASLTQAVRKAPPSALGFRLTATKFALIAQLLTGAVPERATFAAPDMRAALGPYLDLTRAVRVGDLPAFRAVVARHADGAFGRDRTLTLAQRLETNVIKTGLRSLATAYARISFADVAAKLGLGSAADAEFLCAKAIHDGVLDASLDHEGGAMSSREVANVYATREPQEALHRRIAFCLDVHNEAVRGLRYPPGLNKADLESAEVRRERERDEAAFAKELEEGGMDGDDDDDDMGEGPM